MGCSWNTGTHSPNHSSQWSQSGHTHGSAAASRVSKTPALPLLLEDLLAGTTCSSCSLRSDKMHLEACCDPAQKNKQSNNIIFYTQLAIGKRWADIGKTWNNYQKPRKEAVATFRLNTVLLQICTTVYTYEHTVGRTSVGSFDLFAPEIACMTSKIVTSSERIGLQQMSRP